ncbi:MAG: hypothetical protein N3G22_03345 [Candidatus Micrarchaeota archaeon]|nr:hypothetical protein [Candidatus Micrarchaeota archaeon]
MLLALIFHLPEKEKGQAQESQGGNLSASSPVVFGLHSAWLADSKDEKVAVLHLYLSSPENGSVLAFCSPKPIQKNIVVLDHPAAPGVSPGLSSLISKQLSRCGFSSRLAPLGEALSLKDSVVIAPTGAIPQAFFNSSGQLAEKNTRLIVIGSLPGRAINEQGELYLSSAKHNATLVALEPGKEEEAARKAAQAAIFSLFQGMEFPAKSANMTVPVPVEGNLSYCRAVYLSQNNCRFADSGPISALAGRIKGPSEVIAGSQHAFEFSISDKEEEDRFLRFFAVVHRGREQVAKQEIAGGKIKGDWASRFSFSATSGGDYLLQVVDQFGRLHAVAYVRALGLEIEPKSAEGNRLEFSAYFGDRPVSGAVQVWLDSGEKKEYYASNGTLVVWAAPSPGRHRLNFAYSGAQASYEFSFEGGSPLDAYIRLGIPAIILLVAMHFLLRARRKERYIIKFPDLAEGERRKLSITAKQLQEAYIEADRRLGGHLLPLSPEEISPSLAGVLKLKKDEEADIGSLVFALRQLSKQGEFIECEGKFIPKKCAGNFSAEELSALRLLHDLLLERGILFRRSHVIPIEKGKAKIVLFREGQRTVDLKGKEKVVLLFLSEWQRREFEKALSQPTAENTLLKLAMSNGKLVLALASKKEIERILM